MAAPLHLDPRGLAVSGCDLGPAFAARHWLGRQQLHEARTGDPGIEDGHRIAVAASRLHFPQRQGQPILFARLSKDRPRKRPQGVDERQR